MLPGDFKENVLCVRSTLNFQKICFILVFILLDISVQYVFLEKENHGYFPSSTTMKLIIFVAVFFLLVTMGIITVVICNISMKDEAKEMNSGKLHFSSSEPM